ncbi:hypothetical protein E3N88_20620 [Mikania micrantha]|uniref:Reverse transcriptase zinc-binding domain-containing protein n=1 Tax=Mikania micrantha TaxID=192012 RepID=A0A5N6NJY5_9ASTR|nr:hypothetical protein E3N88_20620 [Mikania micrantha]
MNENGVCLKWNWIKAPDLNQEIMDKASCEQILLDHNLSNGSDKWLWLGGNEDGFAVKDLRRIIDKELLICDNEIFKWSKWMLKKVNFLAWRAGMDRLPTKEALIKRNVGVSSLTCDLCGHDSESADHLFVKCSYALTIWRLSKWCKMDIGLGDGIREVLMFKKMAKGSQMFKNIGQSLIFTTIWAIWKARNDRIFNNIRKDPSDVIGEIKVLSFLWIINRAKLNLVEWKDWCNFDISL